MSGKIFAPSGKLKVICDQIKTMSMGFELGSSYAAIGNIQRNLFMMQRGLTGDIKGIRPNTNIDINSIFQPIIPKTNEKGIVPPDEEESTEKAEEKRKEIELIGTQMEMNRAMLGGLDKITDAIFGLAVKFNGLEWANPHINLNEIENPYLDISSMFSLDDHPLAVPMIGIALSAPLVGKDFNIDGIVNNINIGQIAAPSMSGVANNSGISGINIEGLTKSINIDQVLENNIAGKIDDTKSKGLKGLDDKKLEEMIQQSTEKLGGKDKLKDKLLAKLMLKLLKDFLKKMASGGKNENSLQEIDEKIAAYKQKRKDAIRELKGLESEGPSKGINLNLSDFFNNNQTQGANSPTISTVSSDNSAPAINTASKSISTKSPFNKVAGTEAMNNSSPVNNDKNSALEKTDSTQKFMGKVETLKTKIEVFNVMIFVLEVVKEVLKQVMKMLKGVFGDGASNGDAAVGAGNK